MVRRLCILCFLVALWPGLVLAQSAALMEAFNRYRALFGQGSYAEAERFARKALELGQREFGLDHPTTGILLNDMAALYQLQGRYAEAEPLYKRALAIKEKHAGEYSIVSAVWTLIFLEPVSAYWLRAAVDGDRQS